MNSPIPAPAFETLELSLSGMHCANCAARIEKTLNQLEGVEAVVNFASERAHVRFAPEAANADKLIDAVQAIGYGATLSSAATRTAEKQRKADEQRRELGQFLIAAALTLPLLLQMLWMGDGAHEILPRWLQLLLATPVQFWIGWRFYVGGWKSLKGGSGNMDVLVALGTTAAWTFSAAVTLLGLHSQPVYFEAGATVITLVLLGKLLEMRAKAKAALAIEALAGLQPNTALIERDGQLIALAVANLMPNDIFVLRSGEAVPVDGEVVEGESAVNEAMLTGESLPVVKRTGDTVFAGTVNGAGYLRCRATGVGGETLLSGIIRMVEEAQASKAPVQRLVDQVAAIFVPVVAGIALLTFIGWWVLAGDFTAALINAVAVLVIACPCAMGLATPTALMVGGGRGATAGILIRNAQALELAERMKVLAVDKTGTLTLGKPAVVEMAPTHGSSDESLLMLAASLEQASTHPLAAAIIAAAKERTLALSVPQAVTTAAGAGLTGEVGGRQVRVGSAAYLREAGIAVDETQAAPWIERGCALVAVAADGRLQGWIGITDPVRASAQQAVAQLSALGVEVVMLTGDHAAAAAIVARECGIQQRVSDILPADKAAAVTKLKADGKVVGMAGDGINDTPALAAADISFAIGAGSDAALKTADIALLRDDLLGVVNAIRLSAATLAKIRQNLFWAFGYNVIGIPLAAFGLLNPVIAGAAMAASSVSVVSNSLRLRRWRPLVL